MPCSHPRDQRAPSRFSPGEGIHNRPQATRGLLPPPRATEGRGVCIPGLGEKSSRDLNPAAYGPLSLTIVLVQDCPCHPCCVSTRPPGPQPVSELPDRGFQKSRFLLPACHCARSLITLPLEASGHGARWGWKCYM